MEIRGRVAGIPARLRGIKVGDVVIVRSEEEIAQEFGRSFQGVRCGWCEGLRGMGAHSGREFVVGESELDRIKSGNDTIWSAYSYSWSLDMVKFKDENRITDTVDEEKPADPTLREISIKITNEVIREKAKKQMIEMVDKKQLKMVMAVAASSSSSDKHVPSSDIVDLYLEKWAEAKVDFFLLFGKKLSIVKKVDMEVDKKEMKDMIDELSVKFRIYAPILARFDWTEFVKNEVAGYDSLLKKFAPKYSDGMKLSKVLSSYLQDSKFDIELSKVLQYRTIKGNVRISISPYDYLTTSLNNHNWRSCHSIEDGEYSSGCFSYMLDQSTLVAFKDNGKESDYDVHGLKFTGNSKSWRQLVFVDKESCTMIFGRHYPSKSPDTETIVRHMIEETVANYLEIDNTYYASKHMPYDCFRHDGCLEYPDLKYSNSFYFVRHKKLINPDDHVVKIGVKSVPCLHCGTNEVTSTNEQTSCGCHYN